MLASLNCIFALINFISDLLLADIEILGAKDAMSEKRSRDYFITAIKDACL